MALFVQTIKKYIEQKHQDFIVIIALNLLCFEEK